MKIEIVVGANYGDEGKGLTTEFLASRDPYATVVLATGGSQRGHTVNDPKYGRHVFRHFSSGTFRGNPTYFYKGFLINPAFFIKEYNELKDIMETVPGVFYHPDCYIQLPGDIALNWHIERCRKENKHGSTGCGIWETAKRIKDGNKITFKEFVNMPYEEKVVTIHMQAIQQAKIRCAEENVSTDVSEIFNLFLNDGFVNHFIADTMQMASICQEYSWNELVVTQNHLIIEGGQGLLLDYYFQPPSKIKYTTPFHVGAAGLKEELPFLSPTDEVDIYYVSRTYLTRHGVGDFIEEPGLKFNDITNIKNEWQDSLRFGLLNYQDLFKRCDRDTLIFQKNVNANVKTHIVLTHCNEIDPELSNRIDFISTSDQANEFIATK